MKIENVMKFLDEFRKLSEEEQEKALARIKDYLAEEAGADPQSSRQEDHRSE